MLATEEDGTEVLLLMFDCPFFMKLKVSNLESDEKAQAFLNQWRTEDGEQWLQSVGPILCEREKKNIARYSSRIAA